MKKKKQLYLSPIISVLVSPSLCGEFKLKKKTEERELRASSEVDLLKNCATSFWVSISSEHTTACFTLKYLNDIECKMAA